MTRQNLVRYAKADCSKPGTRERQGQSARNVLSLTCQPFRCADERRGPSATPYPTPLDNAALPGTMAGCSLLPVNLLPRLLAIADPDSIEHCEHEQRDRAKSMSRLPRVRAISGSFLARPPALAYRRTDGRTPPGKGERATLYL